MLIEILSQTSIAGSVVRPGDVVDCSEQDARYLVTTRKARLAASQSLAPLEFGMELDEEPTVEERKPTVRRPRHKRHTTTTED